ncbi:outer membrane lipoprotein-sorting protein [Sulfuriflexus mobilis]|uniref:outer membrane lipoprotein-sorting protein n=1 Tax=Sulfuriflexus mobilis TaxID=1811807 RepID=UPI000F83B863|nr:outer membrane lipoprotein-sorting protein [Sulfuriflexus mobilis]
MRTNLQQKQRKTLILSTSLLLLLPAAGLAGTAEQKGYEISARSDRSDRGFGDSQVKLKMTLRNAAGSESTRTLVLKTLEIPDENVGDKSIIIFDSPADISGTAMLSHAKILDADDQWLYLPALKRIKRISSVNKSGPFVGSEFAFEDLTASELNKYKYKYVGSQACGAMQCDIVERYPEYEYSGYTRQVAWIDQEIHQIRKIEFYERRGELLKTQVMDDYRQYPGNIWRAHHFLMENLQTGKSTELVYADYKFKTGLKDRDFRKTGLLRAR